MAWIKTDLKPGRLLHPVSAFIGPANVKDDYLHELNEQKPLALIRG